MMRMRISKRYKFATPTNDAPRCANVQCGTPLEQPFAILEFTVGMKKKLYRRPFCVECEAKLRRAKNNVIMEIV